MVEINSPPIHKETVQKLSSSISIPLRYERSKQDNNNNNNQDDGMYVGSTTNNTHEGRIASHPFQNPRMSSVMNAATKRVIRHHTPKYTGVNHGRKRLVQPHEHPAIRNNNNTELIVNDNKTLRRPKKEIP